MSKYGARKIEIDGIPFDSRLEANRYLDLRAMLTAKQISDLEMQIPYVLAPKAKLYGEQRSRPAIRYLVDFRYRTRLGTLIFEDSKGMDTPMSRLKRHLMKTVHGIDVRVIR